MVFLLQCRLLWQKDFPLMPQSWLFLWVNSVDLCKNSSKQTIDMYSTAQLYIIGNSMQNYDTVCESDMQVDQWFPSALVAISCEYFSLIYSYNQHN